MGYESKIIVAERSGLDLTDGTSSLIIQVVCEYDLSVCRPVQNIFRMPETPVYFFGTDGNERIEKDCYGKQLGVCTVPQLIDWLNVMAENDKELAQYRRYKPLLAMLKAFDLTQWHDLICIHYGH